MSLYQKLANYHIKFINEGVKYLSLQVAIMGFPMLLIVVGTLRVPSL